MIAGVKTGHTSTTTIPARRGAREGGSTVAHMRARPGQARRGIALARNKQQHQTQHEAETHAPSPGPESAMGPVRSDTALVGDQADNGDVIQSKQRGCGHTAHTGPLPETRTQPRLRNDTAD